MTKIFERAITGFQRPIIFVLMIIACPAMLFLGLWACYGLGFPLLTGEFPMKDNANPYLLYGMVLLICLGPFLLSWVSFRIARKALMQIKSQGLIYK